MGDDSHSLIRCYIQNTSTIKEYKSNSFECCTERIDQSFSGVTDYENRAPYPKYNHSQDKYNPMYTEMPADGLQFATVKPSAQHI